MAATMKPLLTRTQIDSPAPIDLHYSATSMWAIALLPLAALRKVKCRRDPCPTALFCRLPAKETRPLSQAKG
jgi:hypothetical protein